MKGTTINRPVTVVIKASAMPEDNKLASPIPPPEITLNISIKPNTVPVKPSIGATVIMQVIQTSNVQS